MGTTNVKNDDEMKQFRIYDTFTNETKTFFKAGSIMEASYLTGKWYGEDNTDVDVEEVAI